MKVISNTPVDSYKINDHKIYVKREDLSSSYPLPPFSKVRGIYSHLTKLYNNGVRNIGYVETQISMAGWGLAVACQDFGITLTIYAPKYKSQVNPVYTMHIKKWEQFNSEIVYIPAGRAKINFYIAKKLLRNKYGASAVLLPLGLPLDESIKETSEELLLTGIENINTLVVSVGSGTICKGILLGISGMKNKPSVVGVACRTGDMKRKKRNILSNTLSFGTVFSLKDMGYDYMDKETISAPFPCNPFYDRKAWKWLYDNLDNVSHPVMFWNIGA